MLLERFICLGEAGLAGHPVRCFSLGQDANGSHSSKKLHSESRESRPDCRYRGNTTRSTRGRVTVLIPSHNHAAFVGEAIASVARQIHPHIELHVVDDGSRDGSVPVIERALEAMGSRPCRFESQSNQGLCRTLNRMLQKVDTEYVAILNSDDRYAPDRLSRMLQEAIPGRSFFGFSRSDLLSEADPDEAVEFVRIQTRLMQRFSRLPTAGFALLARNLPISSSNFVFSRDLIDRVGGFDPELPLYEDWDFLMQCVLKVEPVCVSDALWTYRLHPSNTWRSSQQHRERSLQRAFDRFVTTAEARVENPLAPVP